MIGSSIVTRTIGAGHRTGHPAAAAGLKAGDTIVAIAGQPVTPDDAPDAASTPPTAGRSRSPSSAHGKRRRARPARARKLDQGAYRIGIEPRRRRPGPGESLPPAIGDSSASTWQAIDHGTVVGHRAASSSARARSEVSSTVGIVRDTAQAYRASLARLLLRPRLHQPRARAPEPAADPAARRRPHRDVDPRAAPRPGVLAARLPALQRGRADALHCSCSTSGSGTTSSCREPARRRYDPAWAASARST